MLFDFELGVECIGRVKDNVGRLEWWEFKFGWEIIVIILENMCGGLEFFLIG